MFLTIYVDSFLNPYFITNTINVKWSMCATLSCPNYHPDHHKIVHTHMLYRVWR